jgi:hypothetical protein
VWIIFMESYGGIDFLTIIRKYCRFEFGIYRNISYNLSRIVIEEGTKGGEKA